MTTSAPTAEQEARVDRALAELVRGEAAWAACDLPRRGRLLDQVRAATAAQAGAWVRAAAAYKRLPDGSPLLGEEWMSGPYPVLTGTAALGESVRALARGRSPVDGFSLATAPGGRVAVRVLPHGTYDRLLLSGFSAEVWMPPGVTAARVRQGAASACAGPSGRRGSAWSSAPATSPPSRCWTCCTSCTPTTGWSPSSSTRSPTACTTCSVRCWPR
ncbi:hypothetical protein [Streptomyces sp. LN699]|uniref:hypothetical protein n=1 Tax=Streptomyces sp. LN699 TaxID=3112981 RepID=UPI003720016E